MDQTSQPLLTETYLGHEIRVFGTVTYPLFILDDMIQILQVPQALETLDHCRKSTLIISNDGYPQSTILVDVIGLTDLIYESKWDGAHEFGRRFTVKIPAQLYRDEIDRLRHKHRLLRKKYAHQ